MTGNISAKADKAAAKKPKKKNCPTKSRRCLMKSEPITILNIRNNKF